MVAPLASAIVTPLICGMSTYTPTLDIVSSSGSSLRPMKLSIDEPSISTPPLSPRTASW